MKHFTNVIAVHGPILRWIEPWYVAYGILGALASGFAALLIALVIAGSGGSAAEIGGAVAMQNIGALFAPAWGSLADRTKAYRMILFAEFIILGVGFICFSRDRHGRMARLGLSDRVWHGCVEHGSLAVRRGVYGAGGMERPDIVVADV